jgi:hypothetical protein
LLTALRIPQTQASIMGLETVILTDGIEEAKGKVVPVLLFFN